MLFFIAALSSAEAAGHVGQGTERGEKKDEMDDTSLHDVLKRCSKLVCFFQIEFALLQRNMQYFCVISSDFHRSQ